MTHQGSSAAVPSPRHAGGILLQLLTVLKLGLTVLKLGLTVPPRPERLPVPTAHTNRKMICWWGKMICRSLVIHSSLPRQQQNSTE